MAWKYVNVIFASARQFFEGAVECLQWWTIQIAVENSLNNSTKHGDL